MTEKEIMTQIDQDFQNFFQRRYDGHVPSGIVEKFKLALLKLPPQFWKCSDIVAKRISTRKEEDLLFVEVGIINNILTAMPLEVFYSMDEFDEALAFMKELEDLREAYNAKVAEVNASLSNKQKRLLNLAGITNSVHFSERRN